MRRRGRFIRSGGKERSVYFSSFLSSFSSKVVPDHPGSDADACKCFSVTSGLAKREVSRLTYAAYREQRGEVGPVDPLRMTLFR